MADNDRARVLYEQCGFVVYGVEPRSVLRDGAHVEELLTRLPLREDPER